MGPNDLEGEGARSGGAIFYGPSYEVWVQSYACNPLVCASGLSVGHISPLSHAHLACRYGLTVFALFEYLFYTMSLKIQFLMKRERERERSC